MPLESDAVDLPEGVKSIRIEKQKVFDGQPFPLVLTPADSFRVNDSAFWSKWVKDNVAILEQLLLIYGAVLFRDFALETPTDFDEFSKAFGYKHFPYLGGVAVRSNIVGNVSTSTEAPPGALIPFHHEMAHVSDYPTILFFYCDVPAPKGGQTPIALSNVIYRKMAEREPELVRRLREEGLKYVRVAPDGDDADSALGRGWQSTFLAADREDAEKKATASGYDYEWMADGCMKTITKVLPAIREDKRTGKMIWFNSLFTCYLAWQDARNDRTRAALFPNGDPIPPEAVKSLEEVMAEAAVSFRWQKKDVVMIDNRQAQHSRSSFEPPRRILASLYKDHQGGL